MTDLERAALKAERIRILREKYGDNQPEVQAFDKLKVTGATASPTTGDRLTTKEVSDAKETVPASLEGAAKGETGTTAPIRGQNQL